MNELLDLSCAASEQGRLRLQRPLELAPYGLRTPNHDLNYKGRVLPPCKGGWQNEIRLLFAQGRAGGQLRDMCAHVGLDVMSIRRLRIGQVPLAKIPVGAWLNCEMRPPVPHLSRAALCRPSCPATVPARTAPSR